MLQVELKSGQTYRGELFEAEDNWNCQLKNVTATERVCLFSACAEQSKWQSAWATCLRLRILYVCGPFRSAMHARNVKLVENW